MFFHLMYLFYHHLSSVSKGALLCNDAKLKHLECKRGLYCQKDLQLHLELTILWALY